MGNMTPTEMAAALAEFINMLTGTAPEDTFTAEEIAEQIGLPLGSTETLTEAGYTGLGDGVVIRDGDREIFVRISEQV